MLFVSATARDGGTTFIPGSFAFDHQLYVTAINYYHFE
jgi:hypothetical protein